MIVINIEEKTSTDNVMMVIKMLVVNVFPKNVVIFPKNVNIFLHLASFFPIKPRKVQNGIIYRGILGKVSKFGTTRDFLE